jgi:hypothetical protein
MNALHHPNCAARLIVGAMSIVACAMLSGCQKASSNTAPPKPVVPAVAAKPAVVATPTNDMKEYVSTFEDLPPSVGKDPFFPRSHRRDPSLPVEEVKAQVDSTLILKGIVGSLHRRIAVINDETMLAGEESLVRTPGGHVKIKCLEIGDDYVTVQVEGEPETRKLVMEQKK